MGIVHLDSSGDRLARGMSWPIGTSSIVQAFEHRADREVWLSVSRSDEVKAWSRRRAPGERPDQLLRIEYSETYVRRQVDFAKRFSMTRHPAWLGMDDPPLIRAMLRSVPSEFMRRSKLTRVRTAETLTAALLHFPCRPITRTDWLLELSLDTTGRILWVHTYERPVREWEQVGATQVPLEE